MDKIVLILEYLWRKSSFPSYSKGNVFDPLVVLYLISVLYYIFIKKNVFRRGPIAHYPRFLDTTLFVIQPRYMAVVIGLIN